jgi:ATP-dependent DNA helicase
MAIVLSNIFNKDSYAPLTELMVRVRYGVRRELLDLVKLRGVGRVRARSMFDHGVRSLDDVRAIEVGRLARVPKVGDALAKSIKEQVGASPGRTKPTPPAKKEEPPTEDKVGSQRSLFDF